SLTSSNALMSFTGSTKCTINRALRAAGERHQRVRGCEAGAGGLVRPRPKSNVNTEAQRAADPLASVWASKKTGSPLQAARREVHTMPSLALLGHSRPGSLDLRFHRIEIEARALLHRRELDGGHRQLRHL